MKRETMEEGEKMQKIKRGERERERERERRWNYRVKRGLFAYAWRHSFECILLEIGSPQRRPSQALHHTGPRSIRDPTAECPSSRYKRQSLTHFNLQPHCSCHRRGWRRGRWEYLHTRAVTHIRAHARTHTQPLSVHPITQMHKHVLSRADDPIVWANGGVVLWWHAAGRKGGINKWGSLVGSGVRWSEGNVLLFA